VLSVAGDDAEGLELHHLLRADAEDRVCGAIDESIGIVSGAMNDRHHARGWDHT